MFDDIPDLAIRGERGIDLFRRFDDAEQKRARYRCLATLGPRGLMDHGTVNPLPAAALQALAKGIEADPLDVSVSLCDATGWDALARPEQAIRLFLHLDFLRAWQVMDLAATRFQAACARDPERQLRDPGRLAGAVSGLFDFNRLARADALGRALQDPLTRLMTAPGYRDTPSGQMGYALRMLGDLALRADDPARALTWFEAAIRAGDNPFRRRRAIEAARAAGDSDAIARHRAAFAARWPLPADLTQDTDRGAA